MTIFKRGPFAQKAAQNFTWEIHSLHTQKLKENDDDVESFATTTTQQQTRLEK